MISLRGFVVGLAALGAATLASAPASAQNWGGLYIGVNAGGLWGKIDGTYVIQPPLDHHSSSPSSGILGGHVGLQHQFGQFVLGIEAAYSGTGSFGGWDGQSSGPSNDCLASVAVGRSCQHRIDSIFTVGPRLGWAPTTKWMLFATGGFASGRVDTRTLNTATATPTSITVARQDGWFLGGGVEYAMTPNWLVGVEYQHVDLRTARHFSSLSGGCCVVNGDTRDIDAEANIVRARLSYKLGRPDPVAEPMK